AKGHGSVVLHEKAGDEIVQQYVIFPIWSSGSTNPQNTDGDAAFDEKEPEFEGRKHKPEVNVSLRYRNLSTEIEDFSDNSINEDNTVGTLVPTVGQLSPNNTDTFSVVGPSNATAGPTHGKSLCIYTSQYLDDPNMPELEDITYSDDEDDEELLQFKMQKVWVLVDLPHGKRAIDLCKAFEKLMKDKFQMSLIRELTFFLGLQVMKKKDGIFISQDKYVAEILKKFSLTNGKLANTLINIEKPLLKDLDVKRIFRYLKGKPHLGLWYPKDSPFNLVAYSDSDYAGASLDRKSTTGGCQFIRCRLISWQCKKQTVVATLSTEAEYVAAASYCAQVLWIQNQMLDYG
nr:hypothetical protein [Tanacetum cinerariifolium]